VFALQGCWGDAEFAAAEQTVLKHTRRGSKENDNTASNSSAQAAASAAAAAAAITTLEAAAATAATAAATVVSDADASATDSSTLAVAVDGVAIPPLRIKIPSDSGAATAAAATAAGSSTSATAAVVEEEVKLSPRSQHLGALAAAVAQRYAMTNTHMKYVSYIYSTIVLSLGSVSVEVLPETYCLLMF
jgi:hypothetical protein